MLISIFLFFGIGCISIGVICVILILVLYIILGRKFDKKFNKKSVFYDPGIFGLSLMIRITSYASCIVFGITSRFNKSCYKAYNGYEFRNDCTKNQIILAKIFIFFNSVFITLAAITIILQFFVS